MNVCLKVSVGIVIDTVRLTGVHMHVCTVLTVCSNHVHLVIVRKVVVVVVAVATTMNGVVMVGQVR